MMLLSSCWTFSYAQASSDKDFINQLGKDMLNNWDVEAYRNVVNLLNRITEYDTKEITNWGLSSLEAMRTAVTEPHFGISDGYLLVVRAANFTGHFKVVNDRWVKEGPANDLQFAFNDDNGSLCVFKMTTSGARKTVYLPIEQDEEDEWEDEDEEGTDIINDYVNGVKLISLEVPEKVDFSMTQGSKQLMIATFTFDLSVLTEDWDPLKNGFIVSMNASFAKSKSSSGANSAAAVKGVDTGTFDFEMNRVGYKPGTGINFSYNAKSEGNTLLSLDLNAPGTLNLEDGIFDFDESGLVIKNIGLQSLNFNMDVMGRLQAKGNIPDLYDFITTTSSAPDFQSEAEVLQFLNLLNTKMSGNFYYNNSTSPSGMLGLAPYYDEVEEEWTVNPTITFTSDNSTFPLQEYFSEENFPEFMGEVKGIFNELIEIVMMMRGQVEDMYADALAGIENIPNAPALSMQNGQLLLTGHRPGATAEVYTIGGRLCSRKAVGSNGQATISLSSLPNGIYVVKTPVGIRKFVKK